MGLQRLTAISYQKTGSRSTLPERAFIQFVDGVAKMSLFIATADFATTPAQILETAFDR